jgi:RHS repeat-associated protein
MASFRHWRVLLGALLFLTLGLAFPGCGPKDDADPGESSSGSPLIQCDGSQICANSQCVPNFFLCQAQTIVPSTVALPFAEQIKFLYTAPTSVQWGMDPLLVNPKQVGVLKGRAFVSGGSPLIGALVEFVPAGNGTTLTDINGRYYLVVNAAGPVRVRVTKPGYFAAERVVTPLAHEYVNVPEMELLTAGDFGGAGFTIQPGATTWQRGAFLPAYSDSFGSRTLRLLIPPNTSWTHDGLPLTDPVKIRAPEYSWDRSVPAEGVRRMPGSLPPASAYTYAVELYATSPDDVREYAPTFGQPLFAYLDNFLNLPVGATVPSGSYDYAAGSWKQHRDGAAALNGVVINITGWSGGAAIVDTGGSGLTIPLDERQQLFQEYQDEYPTGLKLWRVPLKHFSPCDWNWPFGFPGDAVPPGSSVENDENNGNCAVDGSTIECERQVLGEEIAIPNTPYSLVYRSNRTPGYTPANRITVKVSAGGIPGSANKIKLSATVGGKDYTGEIAKPGDGWGTDDYFWSFLWDGTDVFGHPLTGPQKATVNTGLEYDGDYGPGAQFGLPASGDFATADETRQTLVLWNVWKGVLGGIDARKLGFGGWMLDVNHLYSSDTETLYYGHGGERKASALAQTIKVVPGTFNAPKGLAFGPDGALYIANSHNYTDGGTNMGEILKYSNGSLTALSGTLMNPTDVAVGADGTVYATETMKHRVVKWNGATWDTIAGLPTGVLGDGGNGPATTIAMERPQGLALAADGSLYISDTVNNKVRRLGTDGVLTTVVNVAGTFGVGGDTGLATAAQLMVPVGLAVGLDGSLYIADVSSLARRVRRVAPDGKIYRFAGHATAGSGSGEDGVLATSALLDGAMDVAVGPDGSVFIAERDNEKIRRVAPDGTIITVAGTGVGGICNGDDGPATAAQMEDPGAIAFGPDEALYLSDYATATGCGKVRKVSPPSMDVELSEVYVPNEDGSEVYIFSSFGHHLKTEDARTGKPRFQFCYADYETSPGVFNKLLWKVSDLRGATSGYQINCLNGLVTAFQRATDGTLLQILPPFFAASAQTTTANVVNSELLGLTFPAGNVYSMQYWPGTLLKQFDDAKGTHQFTYETDGRLKTDRDSKTLTGSAFRTLTRSTGAQNTVTVAVTSALGVTTSYADSRPSNGTIVRTITASDGSKVEATFHKDGKRVVTMTDSSTPADRSQRIAKPMKDPRYGLAAATSEEVLSLKPGDTTKQLTTKVVRTTNPSTPPTPHGFTTLTESRTITPSAGSTFEYKEVVDKGLNEIRWSTPALRNTKALLDTHGRVQTVKQDHTSPEVADVVYLYDAYGRVTKITQGQRRVRFDWGADGRLYQLHRGTPTLETRETTTFTWDNNGRLKTRVTGANQTELGWDGNDNLELVKVLAVAPSTWRQHSLAHDFVDLLASYNPPDVTGVPSDTTIWTPDKDRRFDLVSWPNGASLDATYDGVEGNLTGVTGPSTSTSFTYDAFGRPDTVTRSNVATKFEYTAKDKLLSKIATTWPSGTQKAVDFDYDAYFRLNKETVIGNVVDFTFDSDSLITHSKRTGVFDLDITDRSAKSGRIQSVKAALSGAPLLTTTYNYDTALYGDLLSLTTTGKYVLTLTYNDTEVNNSLGRIYTKTESVQGGAGVTTTYLYTPERQLWKTIVSGVTTTYTYSPNGNLTSLNGVALAYDEQDRLLTFGSGVSYAYDAAGRRVRRCATAAPCNPGLSTTTAYTYDDAGNLTSVALPNSGGTVQYTFDGLGRRVTRVKGAAQTRYLYAEGNRLVAELDSAGALVSQFVYGSQRLVPDLMTKGGVVYRILTDHLGSVRLVVKVSDGSVAQRIDYDVWGKVTNETGVGFQPFGFAGGLWDAETKLVHFGARAYDPEVGRFLTQDPILFEGGHNLYAYAANDPVNLTDPDGTIAVLAVPVARAAAGAVVGGGMDIAMQLATNGGNFDCINWGSVATSAAIGGLFSAVAPGSAAGWRALAADTRGSLGRGLTRRQAGMLDALRSGHDVSARNIDEARLLVEHSGLKPFTSGLHLPGKPAPRGTFRGDLINTMSPTGPIHGTGSHAATPHYNLYFFDGAKAAIFIP